MAAPDHELVKRGGNVSASDIVRYPFISREEGSGTREVITQYLLDQNVNLNEMNFCLELGSPESIKGSVEAGMGITIISRSIIDKELKLNTLCELQLDPPLNRPFSFVRQRQKFRVTVMEKLLEFAKSYFNREN